MGIHPRRQRRVSGESYQGYRRYFATTCTVLRRPVFNQRWVATQVTAHLRQTSTLLDFALPAYCLMPDHLHLLVHATSERADFIAFMKRFKQLTGFAYKRQTGHSLWQSGYYDRILRDEESSESVARYILENPIRAGLTSAWGEYPYAWSDVYDLQPLFADWRAPDLKVGPARGNAEN